MPDTRANGQGYEAPAIVVIGPVEELTLGDGGTNPGDANATYTGPV
jgi:hypothetical protein